MKDKYAINVYSEIGTLKSVMLHRPGDELSNLTPDLLEKLLFDDTPDLPIAQQEHDELAKVLRDNGVEVLYIEKMVAETIAQDKNLRTDLLDRFLKESGAKPEHIEPLRKYLDKLSDQDMVNKMIAGVTKYELGVENTDGYPLAMDPLPNLLFQRDPFASIGNGTTVHQMFTITRRRETIFADLVLHHHPRFKDKVNFWYDRNEEGSIEGGDVLVLNHKTLIIGASQRTSIDAIKKVAKRVIESPEISYEKVIVFDLKTKNRAFMHLDTVFTNIDYDKFIAHPLIFDNISEFKLYEISKDGMTEINKQLDEYLSDVVGKKIHIVKCGGENPIAQAREQWNDGTNVITIKPGEVIAYNRNHITIAELKKLGVKVHVIDSAELSRGRGGPRCMTMPIWREDI
ncbi:arginine deiminase [Spiroplasma mirum ATCC 29335]|uniref:Arginine deiminase n=1 Tax=Spiroplasma mirum ATCC 29335 TaxID=838561 RepID=W0GQ27_9MOLU|nr:MULTISPECIES: arginine deiminase [Spiroplasma]AHF60631.1 arginine deiminase [Spiroplasma mirum ATCC 29335]AHI57581.1 arginine deiminase [Spiroplasma mirum ATCC 29335]AKM52777.1 arginine deiminase [Spiroplasma atrichopogonis]